MYPLSLLSDVGNFQVVFSLVEPAGDMYALPGDLIDANEWVRVFLQTGGMQHLLALLGKDGGIDPSQVSIHVMYGALAWCDSAVLIGVAVGVQVHTVQARAFTGFG